MLDILLRFLVGGIAVSAFAALGDALRPRTFAGLFGAAPSIALATILLALSGRALRSAPPKQGRWPWARSRSAPTASVYSCSPRTSRCKVISGRLLKRTGTTQDPAPTDV